MPTPAPPSASVMSSEPPSTSAMPVLAPPTTFAVPTPAPTSTSPRATIPAAGKSHKKPGHEAPRSGSKKSKKIATQASPMILTRSLVVNMLARSSTLKRASSAVRHASAKRANSTDPLESPSQRTSIQNTPSLQDLSPAARPVRNKQLVFQRGQRPQYTVHVQAINMQETS